MSNNFYLDVFNKIFEFNDHKIMIVFDKYGEVWFKLGDIFKVLGYKDIRDAIRNTDIDDQYIKYLKNITYVGTDPSITSKHPKTKMVNNNGLFMVLSNSTKPLAKKFMKKYIEDIMPTITKTGKYISSKDDQDKIDKLNEKIKNLKNENNYLDNKYRFKPSPHGYLYICETECIIKGRLLVSINLIFLDILINIQFFIKICIKKHTRYNINHMNSYFWIINRFII
jgi:prophage antirepressor-like protein